MDEKAQSPMNGRHPQYVPSREQIQKVCERGDDKMMVDHNQAARILGITLDQLPLLIGTRGIRVFEGPRGRMLFDREELVKLKADSRKIRPSGRQPRRTTRFGVR